MQLWIPRALSFEHEIWGFPLSPVVHLGLAPVDLFPRPEPAYRRCPKFLLTFSKLKTLKVLKLKVGYRIEPAPGIC
jgi:hypothetical protein